MKRPLQSATMFFIGANKMPYVISFLAGIVGWNVFDRMTESKSGFSLLNLATNAVLLYVIFNYGKKLLK